jgi:hypothetical protein
MTSKINHTAHRLALSISLSLALMSTAGAAAPVQAERTPQIALLAQPDPAQQIMSHIRALQSSDMQALLRSATDQAGYDALRAKYEFARSAPIGEHDRKEFAESFGKLLAPDAENALMQEIEPELVKNRPQMAGALLMGFGAMQMALAKQDDSLSEAERSALQALVPEVQKWAGSTDFLSSDLMRKVIRIGVNTAKNSGIRSLDDAKALSFEQATQRADQVLLALKQAALVYNLPIDQILDSTRVQTLKVQGTEATVRSSVTVFGVPLSHEFELSFSEGRWQPSKRKLEKAIAAK